MVAQIRCVFLSCMGRFLLFFFFFFFFERSFCLLGLGS